MKEKTFQNKSYFLKELVELLRSSVSRGASRASYPSTASSCSTPSYPGQSSPISAETQWDLCSDQMSFFIEHFAPEEEAGCTEQCCLLTTNKKGNRSFCKLEMRFWQFEVDFRFLKADNSVKMVY